jgi:hypothetical protein
MWFLSSDISTRGRFSVTLKKTVQKCCPVCRAEDEFAAGDTHEDSVGRYD